VVLPLRQCYQLIFGKDKKSVIGAELLTREFPINEETDLCIFIQNVKVAEKLSRRLGVPVHVNLLPNTLKYINWESIKHLKDLIVLEIVEKQLKREDVIYLNRMREVGFKVALDDFGVGYSNFHLLDLFPFDYVKADGEVLSKFPELSKYLKGTSFLIAEKRTDVEADGYQSFSLHYPEPVERLLCG